MSTQAGEQEAYLCPQQTTLEQGHGAADGRGKKKKRMKVVKEGERKQGMGRKGKEAGMGREKRREKKWSHVGLNGWQGPQGCNT